MILDQHEFEDENGTLWLDRPGEPHAPWGTLGVLVCLPLLLLAFGSMSVKILGGFLFAALCIIAILSIAQGAVTQAQTQTCPMCHFTAQRGYVRCRCGYPDV